MVFPAFCFCVVGGISSAGWVVGDCVFVWLAVCLCYLLFWVWISLPIALCCGGCFVSVAVAAWGGCIGFLVFRFCGLL